MTQLGFTNPIVLLLSVEETKNLTTDMSFSTLIVIHDTLVGRKHDIAELSGWKNLVNKFLEILQFEVESWRDDTALVKSTIQVNNNLTISGIINDLEGINVTMLLHDSKELDDNLGDWSDHNLFKIHLLVNYVMCKLENHFHLTKLNP